MNKYRLKYKNGAVAVWLYNENKDELDISYFDSDGFYNASKSLRRIMNYEDFKRHLDAVKMASVIGNVKITKI